MYLPKDRVTNNHQGYGFVEFKSEEDADYVSTALSPRRLCAMHAAPAQASSIRPLHGTCSLAYPPRPAC